MYWATELIESLGYPGIIIIFALEEFFPPIPAEVLLPFAGFLTANGRWMSEKRKDRRSGTGSRTEVRRRVCGKGPQALSLWYAKRGLAGTPSCSK